jgi:UDP-N-acetylmuramate dehydrogenase
MEIKQQFSLQKYNTFGIDKKAKTFVEITEVSQLSQLYSLPNFAKNHLILGGGSNILLTQNFEGTVVKNSILGIQKEREDNDFVWVKAFAGENWHQFVLYCIKNNFGGVENLSLIPGQVGASPMQNIGAYGVEIKDVFFSLEAWNIEKKQIENFYLSDCEFGYRESVFKKAAKGKYIIVSVTFQLTKHAHKLNTSYGAIEEVLSAKNITAPTIKDISDAVISIRQSKLPNPAEIGNAGSFFKNPEVSVAFFEALQLKNPNIPFYKIDEVTIKIPAGWLIEQAGWKGKTFENYGVHKNQALVLVNYGGADGNDIKNLAFQIQADIEQKFGIKLTPEVNFI